MRKKRKKLWMIFILFVFVMLIGKIKSCKKEPIVENQVQEKITKEEPIFQQETENRITDWRLTLVNQENALPIDFEPELTPIDGIREFDIRAMGELKQMLEAMKNDGITNIWVQSGYRSVEHQKELFEHKIKEYEAQGKTHEEAEKIVLRTINKPGTSEHNLGLAVDFNYVDYSFDETQGFHWLEENAQNYGFILRYQKEKEEITKVDYEPWHWRYVGQEHAIKIKELGMCLEEYVEYLGN